MCALQAINVNLDDLNAPDSVMLCTALVGKEELAWLELTMPGSLFDGRGPGQTVRVIIGARPDGKSCKYLDTRPSFYSKWRLAGEFSSLPAIQKFQKAVVDDWKGFDPANGSRWAKGTTVGKSLTSPSFVAKALKTGFDAIGVSQSAYSGMKLSDWSVSDLKKYAETRKKVFTWRDHKLGAFADIGSAFIELAPDPALERVEREAITNPDVNMKARNISHIPSVKSSSHSGNFAYAQELKKVDLPRVIGYGFRGDSRDPVSLKDKFSGAFTPNFTRVDQNKMVHNALAETVINDIAQGDKSVTKMKKLAIYTRIENARKLLLTKGPGPAADPKRMAEAVIRVMQDANVASELRALFASSKANTDPRDPQVDKVKVTMAFTGSTGQPKTYSQLTTGALDLGEFVQNEFMGGFISVSRSIMVAKSFACGRGGNSLEGRRDGWVYACFVEGAINLPLKGTHPLAKKQEFEMSMPGMLEWDDIIGWRKVLASGKFDGAIYLRHSLYQSDPAAFRMLYEYFSGKVQ